MRPLQAAYAFDCVFLFPAGDRPIGRALQRAGEFAAPEVDFLAETLGPAGTLYDVGANIGAISVPLAARLPDARIHAFEPQPALCELLRRNLAMNGLANASAWHAALGEREDTIDFPAPPLEAVTNFGGIGRDTTDLPTAAVPLRRIDSLDLPPPTLIKIDVEGFEAEVLDGAAATLAQHRPTVFCEAHGGPRTEATARRLLALGYRLFHFFAPYLTPANPRGAPVDPVPRGDMNLLALPDDAAPLWPLPEATLASLAEPQRAGNFRYLTRYGFSV